MTDIKLSQTPKNPIIIEGVPGFGMVGSITTEFLIEHLQMQKIGSIQSEKMPAMVAVHQGKLVSPAGIYYDEKNNLLLVHVIANTKNIEWDIADSILQLAHQVQAEKIISLEGVASGQEIKENEAVMYYNHHTEKPLEHLKPLNEGIIMGVSASIILRDKDIPLTALFALTNSQLPDSKAAAELVKVLDQMFSLNVDHHPLLEAAKMFEDKIKTLMNQAQNADSEQEKKNLSYVG